MAAVDTNVLVRLLVRDDDAQTRQVLSLIRQAQAHEKPLFVPVTVVLELEWVLRSRYGYAREAWTHALVAMLEARELEFQCEDALEVALQAYSGGNADFADCLHAGLSETEGRMPLMTFDAKAAKVDGVKLIAAGR